MRDYYVVAPRDGSAAYTQADHHGTMANIERFFGVLSTLNELSTIWDSLIR